MSRVTKIIQQSKKGGAMSWLGLFFAAYAVYLLIDGQLPGMIHLLAVSDVATNGTTTNSSPAVQTSGAPSSAPATTPAYAPLNPPLPPGQSVQGYSMQLPGAATTPENLPPLPTGYDLPGPVPTLLGAQN